MPWLKQQTLSVDVSVLQPFFLWLYVLFTCKMLWNKNRGGTKFGFSPLFLPFFWEGNIIKKPSILEPLSIFFSWKGADPATDGIRMMQKNGIHGLSFNDMGVVKKQECQWFPRTKWVGQNPEVPIRKKLVGRILSF